MTTFDAAVLEAAGFQFTQREFIRYCDEAFSTSYLDWGFDAPAIKRQEVALALSAIQLPASARILDLACGNGVSSIDLADHGYQVTALDLSQVFVDAGRDADAESAASREGGAIEWVVANAYTYEAEPFDAIILLDPGFMTATRSFAELLSRLSRTGGGFFLRYKDGTHGSMNLPMYRWRTDSSNGTIFLERHHFCQLTGSVQNEWITVDLANKTVLLETMERRIVLFPDFQAMLEDVGFRLAQTWGDASGGAVSDNSRIYAYFVKE